MPLGPSIQEDNMALPTELGGKGNPRILSNIRWNWEAGEEFNELTPGTTEYTVTLWRYTIPVPTRAEATQLLYAISHIVGNEAPNAS